MRKVKIPFNKPYVGPGEVMGVLRAALGEALQAMENTPDCVSNTSRQNLAFAKPFSQHPARMPLR